MHLTDDTVRSLRIAKVFRQNENRINSVSFFSNGEAVLCASDDDTITIYDCMNGIPKRILNSRKYGADLIRWTHANNAAIHASTKVDDSIRYLSLHDHKYIRYFSGHSKKVTCLCMSPIDDTFLSGSNDKTLRLWDLRIPVAQGIMRLNSRPIAAFDPEGLIFATGINSEAVKLYDLRSYEKGPFTTFKLEREKDCDWTEMKFSPDGKLILISTNGSVIRLLDAFAGQPIHSFVGHTNAKGQSLEASFSPDAQFVFAGSTDGKVHCWQTSDGARTILTSERHTGAIYCCQFNPKYVHMVTTCQNMAFWLHEDESMVE